MKTVTIFFLCLALSGCGRDTAGAIKAFQDACAAPISMDMTVSTFWTSLEVHCDKVVEKK